jgi:predicted ferric reductase
MMGSQYYCYAAIAVWSAALIWRHGAVLFGLLRHLAVGQGLPRARIEILPGDLIKLTVRTKMSWKPGQHIFLRVLTCRPVETHPFTIASLPGSSSFSDAEKVQATDGLSDLVLLIRPENGFTRSLFSLVKAELAADREAQVPILIDGPYGEAVDVRTFDSVLLIAGGTGISFVLPVLRDVIDAPRTTRAMKKIRMVWAARDASQSSHLVSARGTDQLPSNLRAVPARDRGLSPECSGMDEYRDRHSCHNRLRCQ